MEVLKIILVASLHFVFAVGVSRYCKIWLDRVFASVLSFTFEWSLTAVPPRLFNVCIYCLLLPLKYHFSVDCKIKLHTACKEERMFHLMCCLHLIAQ